MNINNTTTFIGHRDCVGIDESALKTEIEKLIRLGVTEFLNGGMGKFDLMCARIVHELKKQYSHIKNYLVVPYLSFGILKDDVIINREFFDCIIYPEGFEKYHFKAAIIARNKYLVDNSSYAICYITNEFHKNGAAATYKRAIKNGLTVINLGKYHAEK